MRSSHIGRGPGLIDEDEALGIEIELHLEPGLAALRDVRPILFAGVCGLFFSRDGVAGEEAANRAVAEDEALALKRAPRSSWIAMSGVASRTARIVSLCASIRPDLRSPLVGRARASPCSRSSARQRLTLAALTPNRSPTARCDSPRAAAASTRTRRSNERDVGMSAGPHPADSLNQNRADS